LDEDDADHGDGEDEVDGENDGRHSKNGPIVLERAVF
jgi:hypothetical protein